MRSMRLIAAMAALTLALSVGCSQQRANNPSMKGNVETSLQQAGFNKINVDEDRDKGVITIKGEVSTQADKERAEQIARQSSGNNVVANEILVTGLNEEKAENVAAKGDDAIEARFKEWVAKNEMENQYIHANAKNGVLTLTGDVDTPAQRLKAEKDAAKIQGVTQVVNKLEVKHKKRG